MKIESSQDKLMNISDEKNQKLKKSLMDYENGMTPGFQEKKEILKSSSIAKTGRKGKTIHNGDDTK